MGIKEVGTAALKMLGVDPVAIIDKAIAGADRFIQTQDEKTAFLLAMEQLKKDERLKQMDREMKAAEMLHAERLAEFSDTASARGIKGVGEWIQAVLAILFTLSFFVLIVFIMFLMKDIGMTPEQTNIVFLVFGAVSGIMVTIIGFYFGSSKGSRDKDNSFADDVKKIMDKKEP